MFRLAWFLYSFFFFFSSRRRHTRCLSDWSSDVCSSDLARARRSPSRAGRRTSRGPLPHRRGPRRRRPASSRCRRSEERRVGKESRSRGTTTTEKKRKIKTDEITTLRYMNKQEISAKRHR